MSFFLTAKGLRFDAKDSPGVHMSPQLPALSSNKKLGGAMMISSYTRSWKYLCDNL